MIDQEITIAPEGQYRVVEIDIRAATGFPETAGSEGYATIISDHESLSSARRVARRREGGRFARQIHDDTGKCIAYYD